MTGKHKYIPDHSAHRCRSWALQISCAHWRGPFFESPDAQGMFYVQEDRGYTVTAGLHRKKKYGHVLNSTTNPPIQATNIVGGKEAARGILRMHSFQKISVPILCQLFSKDASPSASKLLTQEKHVSCLLEVSVWFKGLETPACHLPLMYKITRKVILWLSFLSS